MKITDANFFHPHIPQSDHYLHYWAKHATDTIAAAAHLADQTETEILASAKQRVMSVWAKQRDILKEVYGDDQQTLTDIEYIISGKFLNQRDNIINQEITQTVDPLPFQEVIGITPEELIKDAQEGLAASQEFLDQLNRLENEILSQINGPIGQDYVGKYAELVEDYFLGTKGKYSGPQLSDIQATILNSLLAREGQALYKRSDAKYKADFAKLNGDQAKILVAIQLLKNPANFTSYIKAIESPEGVVIRHGDGSEKVSKDKIEVITEFFNKILKWKDQGTSIAAEAASGAGALSAFNKASRGFKDMEANLVSSGTKNFAVQTDFSGTRDLFERVGADAWGRASTKRVGKSDNILEIRIGEGDGAVILKQGITVKNYRSVNITGNKQSVDIEIQKGTPLLTLLVREAGLSNDDMWNLIQVGTAVGTNSDYEFGLYAIWDQVIERAKYLALLDTLAGFTNESDQALYMVFNGQFYSIVDILDKLDKNNGGNVSWTTLGDTDQAGLRRITYLKMNKWQLPNNPNPEVAETRSDALMTEAMQKMYETKIRVKIHISQLATLMAL